MPEHAQPAAADSDRRRRLSGPANRRISSRRDGFWRSQISGTRGVPFDFFRLLFRAPGARCPGEVSSWVPPCVMGATFAPPPAEGPETYARERNPGRGSATGSRKVPPPAGPSSLTPSSPGEAKSRSREAPRCPSQLLASLTRKWSQRTRGTPRTRCLGSCIGSMPTPSHRAAPTSWT